MHLGAIDGCRVYAGNMAYATLHASGGQNPNVGMLPPSDSDEEEDDEPAPARKGGQNPNVGMLPPSDSDEDDDSDDSEDEQPPPRRVPRMAVPDEPRRCVCCCAGCAREHCPCRRKDDDTPDPEEVRRNLERLEMIRKKREEDRLQRIKDEGWDRYAPESDTNRR